MFRIILFISLLGVSGCSLLTPPVSLSENPQHMQLYQQRAHQLVNLSQWQLACRFAITGAEEAWNGSIGWQQTLNAFDIRLTGPFGAGSVRLWGDELLARIEVAKDKYFIDNDVENLISNHLGVKLPLRSLRFWLMGMAIPDEAIRGGGLDEQGLLTHLKQHGWQVQFKRYAQYEGHWLPNKIFLENEEYVIKLVITQWKLHDDSPT